MLRSDAATLDAIAETAFGALHRVEGGYPVGDLEPLLGGVLSRVVRLIALDAGCPPAELFRVHVDSVRALTEGPASELSGRQVQLPGHVTAYREGNLLKFRRTVVSG